MLKMFKEHSNKNITGSGGTVQVEMGLRAGGVGVQDLAPLARCYEHVHKC